MKIYGYPKYFDIYINEGGGDNKNKILFYKLKKIKLSNLKLKFFKFA